MKKAATTLFAAVMALGILSSADAQSTINTGQPATESDLNSLVVRQLATAAASDINGILSGHPAASIVGCPDSPAVFTDCLVVGSSPFVWYKWLGNAVGYAQIGTLDPAHLAFGAVIAAPSGTARGGIFASTASSQQFATGVDALGNIIYSTLPVASTSQAGTVKPDGVSISTTANGTASVVGYPGIDANALIVATSTYNVTTATCGHTVQIGTGSSGYFGVALPGVAGFPANCSILFYNGDTVRGKFLAGFPTTIYPHIYPGETWGVKIVNGAWVAFNAPGRWVLQADTTIYVDPVNGNDNNDGLVAGSGGAFLTRQEAWDAAANRIDLHGHNLIIQHAAGTYTDTLVTDGNVPVGGHIILQGDTTTPDNVVISPAGTANGIQVDTPLCTAIKGFKFQSTTSSGIAVYAHEGGCAVINGPVDFGVWPGTHIAANHAYILITSSYTISGPTATHLSSSFGGDIEYIGGTTVTITGTPLLGTFASALDAGTVSAGSITFSGSASSTTSQYNAQLNGIIDTHTGSPANYFPGGTAGTTATGGQVH